MATEILQVADTSRLVSIGGRKCLIWMLWQRMSVPRSVAWRLHNSSRFV